MNDKIAGVTIKKLRRKILSLQIGLLLVIFLLLIASIGAVLLYKGVRENDTKVALFRVRSAVAFRYAQNMENGFSPAMPPTIEATMFAEGKIPIEPFSGSNRIEISTLSPDRAGSGWRYNNINGQVWINDIKYAKW